MKNQYDKIIQENRWFHGDTAVRENFSNQVWDRDRTLSSLNAEGPGIYFTNSRKEAAKYATEAMYEGKPRSNCRFLYPQKPTKKFLKNLIFMASKEERENLIADWQLPMNDIIEKYHKASTENNAAIELYNDLFHCDANKYITALCNLCFHAALIPMQDRYHIVIWSPEKFNIEQIEQPLEL